MSERIKKIKKWLQEELQLSVEYFQAASSDASFRRYFRVSFASIGEQNLDIDKTYIVMDAPPEKESIRTFVDVARHFEQLGIHVPHIYAEQEQQGFLLLSDLGVTAYLDVLSEGNAEQLYTDAFEVLLKMQMASITRGDNKFQLPPYSEQLLRNEMQLMEDWFIKVHLNYQLTASEQKILQQTLTRILGEISQQPQVIVHRDYHSRNLMLSEGNNPGVIDFQDAVIGPCSYDCVSLLNDSYIAWPQQKVDAWIYKFYQMLISHGVIAEVESEVFQRWFTVMAMQRQIKVVGIFCRLYYRDGKENYLADVPQTMAYLLRNSQQYAEYQDFYQLLLELNHAFEKII